MAVNVTNDKKFSNFITGDGRFLFGFHGFEKKSTEKQEVHSVKSFNLQTSPLINHNHRRLVVLANRSRLIPSNPRC